jgi:drug/metabolite transporter (DMT)-like permease
MTRGTGRANWVLFGLLGLIWGSSYLFIKIGVESLGPLTLVSLRCFFAALFLLTVVVAAREPLPRDPRTLAHLAALGVLSIFLPFVLITWGETHISSGLASVLNGTTPLFTIVVAAVALRDEPLRVNRLVGLVVGFGGVAVVTSPSVTSPDPGDPLALAAQVAVAVASFSYAVGAVYARRYVRAVRPMTISLGMVTFGLLLSAPVALALENPFATGLRPEGLLSVVWLGVLGSGVALLIFYRLLAAWGATRTHVVTYLLPPVGVILGVVVLNERLDIAVVAGTALIIAGVALVNARGRDAHGPGSDETPGTASAAQSETPAAAPLRPAE